MGAIRMTHIEIPLQDGKHLTVVHFPRHLSGEEGATVLRGLEKFAKRGIEFEFFWGDQAFVGPRKNVPARLVEDGNGVFTEVRKQLIAGLDAFHIPYSNDYSGYLMHVTNATPGVIPWKLVPHRPMFVLSQKPHRIEVPFGG